MPISDADLLEAIQKGSLWLKVKKLRALGFITGPIPKLEVTADGVWEIKRLRRPGQQEWKDEAKPDAASKEPVRPRAPSKKARSRSSS